jgi:hypothetical protein
MSLLLLAQAAGDGTDGYKLLIEATKTLGFPVTVFFGLVFVMVKGHAVPGYIYKSMEKRALDAEERERVLEAKVRDDILPLMISSNNNNNEVVRTLAEFRGRESARPAPRRRTGGD